MYTNVYCLWKNPSIKDIFYLQ